MRLDTSPALTLSRSMSDHGPLRNVRQFSWDIGYGNCPSCGLRAQLDRDQMRGKVSVDCPQCEYHETHDHLDAQWRRDDG